MQNATEQILKIEANNRIAEAWEEFTDTGDIDAAAIRNVIRQSWVTSKKLGIDHKAERAPTAISAEQIQHMLMTEDLTRAGISTLNKLEDILHDTKHVVALADPQGHLLYSVGHTQIREKLENINFRPGGAWSESAVGPNGVGTPLALGRPELVMGHEHYCQGWKPWVCYGAPILDATGQHIKGVIDITGPVEQLSKESMALAISVALSVQSGLAIIQYGRRDQLREEARQLFERWPNDGIMLLDENGCIVEFNTRALKMLKLENFDLLNHSITGLIPSINGSFSECFDTKSSIELEIHAQERELCSGKLRVKLKPVINGSECIGVCLIFNDSAASLTGKPVSKPVSSLLQARYSFDDIYGESVSISKTIELAKACAQDRLQNNVLLIGDTGTGKELLAHSIHSASIRSGGPFIAVNCAAIPNDLIESELFGYEPGAFTGARKNGMKGKFEAAHNGTLFLDEINSMDINVQAKLLRVLDSMEVNRVGSAGPVKVDVRVIAAANKDILAAVDEGRFRSDLFHRISVLEIDIPALSERDGDVIFLAQQFIQSEREATELGPLKLDREVTKLLQDYSWPGNVRELYNVCMRWVLTVTGDTITRNDIPSKLLSNMETKTDYSQPNNLQELGDELIKSTLKQTNNNISKAARILGIDRSTIYRRSRKWSNN